MERDQPQRRPASSIRPTLDPRSACATLAAAVRRDQQRLDLLINNAGIGTGSGGQRRASAPTATSCASRSTTWRAFCSPCCSCRCCEASAPARIVNVASAGQSAHRLRRRDARPSTTTACGLTPEQAGADHVHHRSGAGARKAQQHHGERTAPGHLHGHDHGARGGVSPASTVEEGARRSSSSLSRPGSGPHGALFQRLAGGACAIRRPRCGDARGAAQAEHGSDRSVTGLALRLRYAAPQRS